MPRTRRKDPPEDGAELVRRVFASDALLGESEPWTGPVERRAPSDYQRCSVVMPWRCRNQYCGHWTPKGSRAAGMCLFCFTPKPDDVPDIPPDSE